MASSSSIFICCIYLHLLNIFCFVDFQEIRHRTGALPTFFDWSYHGQRFQIARKAIRTSGKHMGTFDHVLSACQVRKSSIPRSGNGVFLSYPALPGQILLQYGGQKLSFTEADRLAQQVSARFTFDFSFQSFWLLSAQGLDTHMP